MFSNVLSCPRCQHRFGFDYEEEFPEQIVCPQCGESAPYENYSALVFCSQCRAKLQIPLDLLQESTLDCPQCGSNLDLRTLFSGSLSETTLTPGGDKAGSKTMFQEGDFIDKYRILRLLGKGGMAEVYLAEHLLLKKYCAIKVMRSGLHSSDEIGVKRFVREAKLAHQINHPNIIKVFDVGNDPKSGCMFLAMEYVEGATLLDMCRESLFSEEELEEVLVAMAGALKVLHQANVVHRDIKPSNIMKDVKGIYRLMDLGIAKAGDSSSGGELTLTMERSAIGTPSYASPEQCQSAHHTDIRSDIYCLGATLYHLATGRLPFEGSSPVEIILKVMREEPVPIGNFRSDLSPKIITLIQCMMKKDPAQRPQTPDELLEMIHGETLIPSLRMYIMEEENEKEVPLHMEKEPPGERIKRIFRKIDWRFLWKIPGSFLKQGKILKAALVLIVLTTVIYFLRPYLKKNPDSVAGQMAAEYRKIFLSFAGQTHPKPEGEKKDPPPVSPKNKLIHFFPVITFSEIYPDSDFLPSMVRDGVLCMDGIYPMSPEAKDLPVYNYRHANSVVLPELNSSLFAVSFDCRIHPENKGPLLVCGMDPQCFALELEEGKLVIEFQGKRKIRTGLLLPQETWFNLMFHCDLKGERLRLFYNRIFMGNYHLPVMFDLKDKRFTFYNYAKQSAFRGEVDNLRFAHGPFHKISRTFFKAHYATGYASGVKLQNKAVIRTGKSLKKTSPEPEKELKKKPEKDPEPNLKTEQPENSSSGGKALSGSSPATPESAGKKVGIPAKTSRRHWKRPDLPGDIFTHYESVLEFVRKHEGGVALFFMDSGNNATVRFLTRLLQKESFRTKPYIPVVLDCAFGVLPEDQYKYNVELMNRFGIRKLPAFLLINRYGQVLRTVDAASFYSTLASEYLYKKVSRTGNTSSPGSTGAFSRSSAYSGNTSSRLNQQKRTIRIRLEECRKRLKELQEQPRSSWTDARIRFVCKQIETLEKQEELLARSREKRRYSPEKTAYFKEKAEEYLKTRTHSGYGSNDIRIGNELYKLLEDPQVDPNVRLRYRYNNAEGDPVLQVVLTGYLQYQDRFVNLLAKKNADPGLLRREHWMRIYRFPNNFFKNFALDDIDDPVIHSKFAYRWRFGRRHVGKIYYNDLLHSFLLLAPNVNVNFGRYGHNLLLLAVERGDEKLAEEVLLAGFTLGKRADPQGRTPWKIAYRRADPKLMDLLGRHNLQTETTEQDLIQHEFCSALRKRQFSKLKELLQKGANPNELQENGLTIFQKVCASGDYAAVAALLNAGVDPNYSANTAWIQYIANPLHIAVTVRNLKIFSLLLSHKMKPNPIVHSFYGGRSFLSHDFVINGMHDPKMSAKQMIAFLEEMRKYSWNVNETAYQGAGYLGKKNLLTALYRVHGYSRQNGKKMTKLLQITEYLVHAGATIDPGENCFRAYLTANRKSSSVQSKIGKVLRKAIKK